MAAPRNPFGGILGGRLPLLEGGLSGRGGARPSLPKRGPGFSRQRQLDLERAVRQAEQNLLNRQAAVAKAELAERGESPGVAKAKLQRTGLSKFSGKRAGSNVSNQLLKERANPLQRQREVDVRTTRDTRFKALMAQEVPQPEPDDTGNVSLRLLKERTRPLRRERAARTEAGLVKGIAAKEKSIGKLTARNFKPLRMTPEQVEATVESFARPVTAQDVRRGGFQAVTRESAPAQELEARLAQVGTREVTADIKVGEPVGFNRTVFSFTNPPERGGSLILTITEIPANNPQGKMIFFSSQRPGGVELRGNVFLVDSRLSALRIVDQVRETASKVPLPRLRVPGKTQIKPRQVFPRPPIPFDKLEKNRVMEFESISLDDTTSFVLNPSLRTAIKFAGPMSEFDSDAEIAGGVRGIVRENGDVVLFAIDLFHDEAMRILGLDQALLVPGGEARPERFILEQTRRKGFEIIADNPVTFRRLLRTNPNVRRLIRPDQLPTMLKGRGPFAPRSPSSPRPTSPATTPREPIL